jgi:hypothetical protein
VFVIVVEPFAV